jgi:hypothetical protein
MQIIFTKHALIKLEHRKINRQFVLETVKNPELIRPTYNQRQELYRKFGKIYMKVVVRKINEIALVITMHWVAKTK